MKISAVIQKLNLKPHPEGGWYREIYRSTGRVQTKRGTRSAITTIYYLLERDQISRWHVVDADEVWHFYEGSPLELLAYDPKMRALVRSELGTTRQKHERVAVVQKGVWQAARSLGAFSLMGCSVGPGFEFDDFRFVAKVRGYRAHFKGKLAPFASLL
jgi:predicted cupin superfamily sugar epimerase